MTLAQTNAVVERVQLAPSASRTFLVVAPRDAQKKLPKAPYCVVQPADGIPTAERFTGGRMTSHPRITLQLVGLSYEQVQSMVEQVKAQFIDARGLGIPLDVDGEDCKNLRWESPQPIQIDNDVTPPLIYATVEIDWAAEPTS